MTDTIKISQLDQDTTPNPIDMIPMVDETNVVTKRVAISDIINLLSSSTDGWTSIPYTLAYSANNGNREFVVTATGNLTSLLSPGMRLKVARATTPPTQCMGFTAASSQYATKSTPTGITFTSAFTIEAWVKLKGLTAGSGQYVIARYDNAGTSGGWGFEITSVGQISVFYGSSSSFSGIVTYSSLPFNQWTHVALVVSSVSSKTMAIYVNGILAPSFTSATASSTLTQPSVDLRIGASSATPSGTYLNAELSEVRVWSAAQTQSNIKANMALNLVGTETNLVALFKGGGNFTDGTSNGNNLTATNGAVATTADNPFGATEYAIVTNVSYTSPTTTVTLYTGNLSTIPNQTLSNPFYSVAATPLGFSSAEQDWTIACYGRTVFDAVGSSSTWYNIGNMQLSMPVGKWRIGDKIDVGMVGGSSGNSNARTTLSTANNSEADSAFSTNSNASAVTQLLTTLTLPPLGIVVTSTGTIYYLNISYTVGSGTVTLYINDNNAGVVYAVCDYL